MQCLISQTPRLTERRTAPRLGFDCPLRWTSGGADRTGLTVNMSDNGLGFVTRALSAPKPGQQIEVTLELDESIEWLVDRAATVVRTQPQDDGFCLVGVRLNRIFTD